MNLLPRRRGVHAHRPPPAVHSLPPTVHRPPSTARRPPPTTRRPQPAAHRPPPAAHRSSPAAHRPPPACSVLCSWKMKCAYLSAISPSVRLVATTGCMACYTSVTSLGRVVCNEAKLMIGQYKWRSRRQESCRHDRPLMANPCSRQL